MRLTGLRMNMDMPLKPGAAEAASHEAGAKRRPRFAEEILKVLGSRPGGNGIFGRGARRAGDRLRGVRLRPGEPRAVPGWRRVAVAAACARRARTAARAFRQRRHEARAVVGG